MATVVLYHSALGLRPGIHALAEALRADGHAVHTPDLYGGRSAATTEEGIALRDETGITTLLARAEAALLDLDGPLVFIGASMGVAPAQLLAAARADTRGVVCLHGLAPPDELGLRSWPDIPLSVHLSPGDPWVEHDQVEAFLATLPPERYEVYRYPRTGHLFSHPEHDDHDAAARELLVARVRAAVRAFEGPVEGGAGADGQ